jgi:hypothetical protein
MAQINLTELDFEQIRTSLRTYLQKQDTVRDLNFEGSAVNFLLDLLAYNTLYYAHYANMISGECFLDSAQLEKSIISLVKPLGYVVPTKTSARTRIQLQNVTDPDILTIPYSVSVRGKTPEGVDYQFWNIDSISLLDGVPNTTEYFSMYEGSYVSLSYGGDGFDFPDQKILIADLNMDIQTLRVSVSRQNANFVYWKLLDTYGGSFVSDSSNLYSIERTSSGFVIKFQTTSSNTANLIGGDIVNIEYLSSNGSNANGTSIFTPIQTPDSSIIVNNQPSFGGLDAPDLDEAKRVAPLVFSAQQRLVTKSDYYGFLAQLGYSDNVNVWGGEDNSPPMYGRVLFSIAAIGTDDNTEIQNIISLIKERSIITVLPEYIPPRAVVVSLKLNVNFNKDTVVSDPVTTVELIKSKLKEAYSTGGYNNSLTTSAIKTVVESFPGYSLNTDIENDLKLVVLVAPSTVISTINLKNRITQGPTTNSNGTGLFSSEFTSPYYTQGLVSIRDKPIKFPGAANPPLIGKLKLYTINSDGEYLDLDAIVGDINYKTGVVTLIPNITSEVFTLNVNPLNPGKIEAKDEIYLSLDITTTKPISI